MRLEQIDAGGLRGLWKFPHARVTLDVAAAVPPGIVSVVGGNGEGKSTLLETVMMALYGRAPSKPDQTLAQLAATRDAFLDVVLTLDGRGTYRARVQIDAVSKETQGILELITPDGARRHLNDGKIKTFREAVAREFPPYELMLASAFAAQGRAGSFATLPKKDRKDLFAALLGLDHYEQMAEAARGAAGTCTRALDQRRGQLEALRPLTDPAIEDELSATGNRLQAEMTGCELDRLQADRDLADWTARVDELQKANARYVAAAAEHTALGSRRADRERQLRQLGHEARALDEDQRRDAGAIHTRREIGLARIAQAIAALPTEGQLAGALDRHLQQLERQLADDVEARQTKIANNRTFLLDRADVIRAAATAVDDASREIRRLDDAQDEARAELARRQRVEFDARDAVSAAQQGLLARERDAEASALTREVPCGGAAPFDACQFLRQAAAARDRLLQAPLAAAQQTLEATADAVTRAIRSVQEQRDVLDQLGRDVAAQREILTAHDSDAKRLPALEHAEARVQELEVEIAELRRRYDEACARAVAQRDDDVAAAAARRQDLERERQAIETAAIDEQAALLERMTERRRERAAREALLADELISLDQQLAALARVRDEDAAAHDDLVAAEAALGAARTRRAECDRQLARIDAETDAFQRRRDEYAARVADRRRLETEIRRIETDLVEWQALGGMLGRDGIPVLEIDHAGPGVSALANDLLQACFGTRFTVELVTQELKADGKGYKESFELKVYDAERDAEPRDLTALSGGEQVIIDESIKSAIALFVNQRNVQPIRTCWRDETIGALDPENALRYVAMLRRLHERGGFHHTFFISHNLDAAALADVQLVVAGGRIDVRYPPFAATEAA